MLIQKGGCVYIMANLHRTALYTGVTSDLPARVEQHIQKFYPESFTAKYNCTILVYFEILATIGEAIAREKQIKSGSRSAKIELIEMDNPGWRDLQDDVKNW